MAANEQSNARLTRIEEIVEANARAITELRQSSRELRQGFSEFKQIMETLLLEISQRIQANTEAISRMVEQGAGKSGQ